MAAFFVVTIVPAAGLIWLAWTLISQDDAIAEKQVRLRLERTADVVVASMTRDLALPAMALDASAVDDGGSDVPAALGNAMRAESHGRLDSAIVEYRQLVESPEPTVRTAAVFGLARVLRKTGQDADALSLYQTVQAVDTIDIFGMPASLQAALARIRILSANGCDEACGSQANSIRSDLSRGRWQLDTAEMQSAWAAVTRPEHLRSTWERLWNSHDVVVALKDADGDVLPAPPVTGPVVVRGPSETGLPWTVHLAGTKSVAELASLAGRRRQLWLVVGLAAFLALAGAYFVGRGVRRELQAAALQSTFVSAVSHEFRTPLTSISHLIEILRDRPALSAERRTRYYDSLEQEAARLRQFVDQLLDLGRLEAGATHYERQPIDAASFVTGVVDGFRRTTAAAGRRVTCQTESAAVAVDEPAIALALNNLLDNAAKYSPASAPIEISVAVKEVAVLVTVRDEGPGIPAVEHERIFERFVRGASAIQSGIRGTGVGLALARDIVRAHDGDITVTSEPGRGSEFVMALPRVVSRPAAAVTKAS